MSLLGKEKVMLLAIFEFMVVEKNTKFFHFMRSEHHKTDSYTFTSINCSVSITTAIKSKTFMGLEKNICISW